MEHVFISLASPEGRSVGTLILSLLPSTIDRERSLQVDPPERADFPIAPEVWVTEAGEYRYEFKIPGLAVNRELTTVHPELFLADDASGTSGRFRPGSRVGTINGGVLLDGELLGTFEIEVRSLKLGYLDEYRWMLEDISEVMSSLLLQQFAPTELRLGADMPTSEAGIYQRIAFLKNFIGSDTFERAMHRVAQRPHLKWREITETRRPGQGLSSHSRNARALLGPGARVPWLHNRVPALPTLPRQIHGTRTEADTDTVENRFVKFALESWRDFLVQTQFVLRSCGPTLAIRRGMREVETLVTRLEQALAADIFHGLGPLSFVPSHSAVLQREEGYRDVYRAFLQCSAAAHVSWIGSEDVFAAGQRNVATLFEYWCFLRIANLVAALCNPEVDFSQMLDDEGNLKLRRGRSLALDGEALRNGTRIRLRLWFNRTFRPDGNRESWSRALRPDISLLVEPVERPRDGVWIHFDAKYEVEATGPLGPDGSDSSLEDATLAEESGGKVKRSSLMKMHAYRDGIFNSAGVYVLYPGNRDEYAEKYFELLPGLGAFVLRPLPDGDAAGADAVSSFIEAALTFLVDSATRFAKSRLASREVYGSDKL